MKRIFAIIIAAAMLLALAMPAWAENVGGNLVGSITIKNASKGKTYTAYMIADLVEYSEEAGSEAYVYKVADYWEPFFSSDEYLGKVYFKVNSDKTLELITDDSGTPLIYKTNTAASDLALSAFNFAESEKIDYTDSVTADSEGNAEFTALIYGYYVVDTTNGSFCSLFTAKPDAEVEDKNGTPYITHGVETSGAYGASNTADIGQTVNFMSSVTFDPIAANYSLYLTLGNGLTLDTSSIALTYSGAAMAYGTDYDFEANDRGFTINFTDSFLAKARVNTTAEVRYSARLNKDAVIGGEGNISSLYLIYGESAAKLPEQKAVIYTYSFDLVKTDASGKLLDGAKFELYDKATGSAVKLVAVSGGYRVADSGESGVAEITASGGKVTVSGLSDGEYYLTETAAPAGGYNRLGDNIEFEITNENRSASVSGELYESGGIRVINKRGVLLPETGGIGTTLFFSLGGVLVIAAGVLLVTKARLAKIKE